MSCNVCDTQSHFIAKTVLVALGMMLWVNTIGLSLNKAKAEDIGTHVTAIGHDAALRGDVDVLEHLIKSGLSPESKSPRGWTLLIRAAANGHLDVVNLLLREGARVNRQTAVGITPLLAAVAGKHAAVVRLLIEHGADVNYNGSAGATPLEWAVANGSAETVRVLLEAGGDPNQLSKIDVTPLLLAVDLKNREIVELLIDAGADVDAASKEGLTPRDLAILQGQRDILSLLLLSGANLETKTFLDVSPLQLANAGKRTDIAELLSRFSRPGSAKKLVPTVEALAVAIRTGDAEQVRLQLKEGLNPNKRLHAKWTPLMLAATSNSQSIVEALLEAGAKARTKSEKGFTALHVAAVNGHSEIANSLVAAGADVSAASAKRVTPADMARYAGHYDLASSLMSHATKGSLASKNFTRNIQSLLYLRGYKVGGIDGSPGRKTVKAVKSFQWGLHGLADGVIDETLGKELRELARDDTPVGNNWGAIVLDKKTAKASGQFLTDTEDEALAEAIKYCRKRSRGCESRSTFKNQCVSLARKGNGWAYSVGDSIWEARQSALDSCNKINKRCWLAWEFCSDGSFSK